MFFDVRPEVEDLSAQAQATAAQHLAGVERQDLSSIFCQIQRFAVRDQGAHGGTVFECVNKFSSVNRQILGGQICVATVYRILIFTKDLFTDMPCCP